VTIGGSPKSGIRRIIQFAAVGVVNSTVDMALFAALVFIADVPLVIANTASYSGGLLNSFFFNKYWTFGDVERQLSTRFQLPVFVGANLVGLAIANVVLLITAMALPVIIAKLLSILCAAVWNFWASHTLVYRRAEETR
jgi:putative flippase GtrA